MTNATHFKRIPTRLGHWSVVDEGAGKPVVLWPSLFSDHRLFAQVQQLLTKGWRTLRIDGPGFGRSDAPLRQVHAHEYAEALTDVLDALGIDKAFVAGCSWGGQIAACFGVKTPARASGVLVMNAPLGPSQGNHAFEVLGTRWFGNTSFWGSGVARSMFSSSSKRNHPERVSAFVQAFASFEGAAASVTVQTVMRHFPGLQDDLPKLKVPTTFLMGAEDRLYPVACMRPFAELTPGAKIVVVPSCGHLAPLEAPEAVVAELEKLALLTGSSAVNMQHSV